MGLLTADDPADTAIAWVFVLVQLALLVAIVVLPPGDAWPVPDWLDLVARILQWGGALLLVLGILNLGRAITPLPTPVPHGQLQVWGLFKVMRHPIYTGVMALGLGTAIRSSSIPVLIAALALVGWFMAKARWEEARLVERYPGYADYAAHTPRFVPFWPMHAPIRPARRPPGDAHRRRHH